MPNCSNLLNLFIFPLLNVLHNDVHGGEDMVQCRSIILDYIKCLDIISVQHFGKIEVFFIVPLLTKKINVDPSVEGSRVASDCCNCIGCTEDLVQCFKV